MFLLRLHLQAVRTLPQKNRFPIRQIATVAYVLFITAPEEVPGGDGLR